MFCLLSLLLRFLGFGAGPRGMCDADPAARARWQDRRREFRRRLREAFDVWRQDDQPAEAAPATEEAGAPARSGDPLED